MNRYHVRCFEWLRTATLAGVGVAAACSGTVGGGDAGPPSGEPATGTAGGSNLACGGASFAPDALPYQDISAAAVDPESAMILAALDASNWADDGDRQTLGIDFSFAVNCAAASVAPRAYTGGDNPPDCDFAPVPLPTGGVIEGASNYACSDGDCHLIVYQGSRLYELYQADVTGGAATGGAFTGTCLAIWDLSHDYWGPANHSPSYSRGDECDGGTASDLPIAPMLLTAQELSAAIAGDGIIHHALRFTIGRSRIRSNGYVHPATHYAFTGVTGGSDTLPTGARLRLRGDYNVDSFSDPAARVVARTLQHYGMFLSDSGNIYISATTDAASVVSGSAVGALRPHDFEMVGGGRRIGVHDYACDHVPITD